MRASLVVIALFIAGVLSQETPLTCMQKFTMQKGLPGSENLSEEKIDCLFNCYLQGANLLKPDGTFNPESINDETNKDLALQIVNMCNETVATNDKDNNCAFAGCLRKNRLLLAYS